MEMILNLLMAALMGVLIPFINDETGARSGHWFQCDDHGNDRYWRILYLFGVGNAVFDLSFMGETPIYK
ncbi:hypothetical protein XBJ1_2721 [Xenorhabdus bovienii SS-2004]|uniref:Uncharacterized protein n=1 Tax=Xenorhabdus bovienii (strain SS-2004) TaxID=406818 RepID=D3V7N3_XENBS|nr:hypothetical protein XBJ1_2721 [Xenorhabdus bovienii SS-2004]